VFNDSRIQITQWVEIVPSDQPVLLKYKDTKQEMRLLNRVLVKYIIENKDTQQHNVGLRFLLDTFIGSNDGVPFTIPTLPGLVDHQEQFNDEKAPDNKEIPDFIQALQNPNIKDHGIVAHLTLKVLGLETPNRVTLGAWPDKELQNIARGQPGADKAWSEMTRWDVPYLDMQLMLKAQRPQPSADSAVVMYWNPQPLAPGAKREVGFAYGLGNFEGTKGKIGLTINGTPAVGKTLIVTALINNPKPGQTATLELPGGFFELVGGKQTQAVPPVPGEIVDPEKRNSPVTWEIRARRKTSKGLQAEVRVTSEKESQSKKITIKKSVRAFR
jgi:hypothetical protein